MPRPSAVQVGMAIVTVTVAGIALAAAWLLLSPATRSSWDLRQTVLLLGLMAALVVTYHFPLHVERSAKIYMGSVVLYLLAALLPPAVAGSAIGLGVVAGELSVCRRTRNHRTVTLIPTLGARWTIIGLLGSLVAHLPSTLPALPFFGAALTLWAGDILTGPLVLSPVTGESPVRIISMMVREGGAVEASQYLIGVMGALVATTQPWALILLILPTAVVYRASKRARDLSAGARAMLEELAESVDRSDDHAGSHARRVAELTQDMLRVLGVGGPEADMIVVAARLHDIGKVRLSDELLHKRGDLTSAERATLRSHAVKGAELVAHYPSLGQCARIIRHHHEAWDGTGFPDGLRGNEIPFGARVVAVAESYDDMTNDHRYRQRMTPAQAAAALRDGRGRQWDPEIVDAFLHMIGGLLEEPGTARLHLVPARQMEGEAE